MTTHKKDYEYTTDPRYTKDFQELDSNLYEIEEKFGQAKRQREMKKESLEDSLEEKKEEIEDAIEDLGDQVSAWASVQWDKVQAAYTKLVDSLGSDNDDVKHIQERMTHVERSMKEKITHD